MSPITVVVLAFSLLGALDYLLGNRLGLGNEFARGFSLFGPMALSMLGMIVLAPAIGAWLAPVFDGFYAVFGIDPSILPASLFANDMGGMQLSQLVCKDEAIGNFNAFVISSMMGCVISFTVPLALGVVDKSRQGSLFFGLLCGIATIPVGGFVAGLICGLPLGALLLDLLPLILLALLVGAALILFPNACIKCFAVFGRLMKLAAVVGLCLAVFTFLTGITVSPHFESLENAAFICVNACITLSGTLPLMQLLSRLLNRPLRAMSQRIGINGVSALALLGTTVTNVTTLSNVGEMDEKGVVLNAAFAVSAAFTFGGHLALTLAYDASYVLPMIVGKLVSGITAVLLALLLYRGQDAPADETK